MTMLLQDALRSPEISALTTLQEAVRASEASALTMLQEALPGLETGVRETRPCRFCAGLGTLEATDIFCGAGGSSLGLEFVCCPCCGR